MTKQTDDQVTFCLYCMSLEVDGGKIENGWQQFKCRSCGKEWYENPNPEPPPKP
jgi:transposase-like protein